MKLALAAGPTILAVCLAFVRFSGTSSAEDLFLADGNAFPGRLWLSEGGTAEREVHRRRAAADPAYPRAIMKLAQVAVGPDGKAFFASGLDGSVMHLLDGRNEIQSFEFPGQIRDLACTGEEQTVYFSVVPTPQNAESLADGKIYRRDLWEGRPTEVATIRQADIGGNWWGTFTIQNGAIYLATTENASRLFKLSTGGLTPIFERNTFGIHGLAAGAGGEFWFTTGGGKVYRTADFDHVEPALVTDHRLSDVSLRAAAGAPRP